jgi:GNAT superfamily N-acetyltransferase
MRANEFVTEIERLAKDTYIGGKGELEDYRSPGQKQLKPLPGGSGLMYAIRPGDWDNSTYIFIVDPKAAAGKPAIVAKLSIEDYNSPIPNAVQVGSITVDEDYRNRGLAKALYGIVLSIMGKTLVAGGEQTPGGRRNWVSLTNIPGVVVKGFVRVPEEDLNFDPDYSQGPSEQEVDRTHNTLMKLGGQFIGANNWSEYWAFDVVPGASELKPAVKTVLSRLYDDGDSETGLYAKWKDSY